MGSLGGEICWVLPLLLSARPPHGSCWSLSGAAWAPALSPQHLQQVGRLARPKGRLGLGRMQGSCLNSLRSAQVYSTHTHTHSHIHAQTYHTCLHTLTRAHTHTHIHNQAHHTCLHTLTRAHTHVRTCSQDMGLCPGTRGHPRRVGGGDPGWSHFTAMGCGPERAGSAKVTQPVRVGQG